MATFDIRLRIEEPLFSVDLVELKSKIGDTIKEKFPEFDENNILMRNLEYGGFKNYDPSDFRRRMGKIEISHPYLFNIANLGTYKALFSNFFPFAIDTRNVYGYHDIITYVGYSEAFDVVEEGEIIPTYSVELRTDEYNNIFLSKFIKQEYKASNMISELPPLGTELVTKENKKSNEEIYTELKDKGLSDEDIAESFIFPSEQTAAEREESLKTFREWRKNHKNETGKL